jgi:flagellar hook capping protein FlgD
MKPRLLIVAAFVMLASAWPAEAIQMPHSVVGSGGAAGAAPGLLVRSTIGEGVVGTGAAPDRELGAGFWFLVAAEGNPTAVPGPSAPPLAFRFHGTVPNPIRGMASFRFDLPDPRPVRLEIYSVAGSLIRSLVDRAYPPGSHVAVWDGLDGSGRHVASGTFLIRIVAGRDVGVRKMTFLR